MKLLCGIIWGLYGTPFLGQQEFWDGMVISAGYMGVDLELMQCGWDQQDGLTVIAAQLDKYDRSLLVGHSHGGHEAIKIASSRFGAVAKVDCLIALDPVPTMDAGWIFAGDYLLPPSVRDAVCILDGMGKPFEPDARVSISQRLDVGHAEIPAAPEVHEITAMRIQSLCQQLKDAA